MLLAVRIRLLSPILGDQYSSERRRFRRVAPGLLDGRTDIWQWAFRTAFTSLRIQADTGTIRLPAVVAEPTTYTHFKHSAESRHVENTRRDEKFEAIRVGTVLTLNFVLTPVSQGVSRVVSVEEFTHALSFIGQFLGVSHWGNDMDYGRFEVVDITPTTEFFHVSRNNSQTSAHRPESGDRPLSVRVGELANLRTQVDGRGSGVDPH